MENLEEGKTSFKQLFKAVCSDCGKECEVPFEPKEGRKVRCQECFRKSKRRRFNRKPFKRRRNYKTICTQCGKECEVPFEPKEGREVLCKECFHKNK